MLFVSCSHEQQEKTLGKSEKTNTTQALDFDFQYSNEIQLPFEYDVNQNLTIQLYSRNDTDFVLLGDIEHSQLIEIDLTHETFSRVVPLFKVREDNYPLFAHHYFDKDTIVILRDISNESGLKHDSLLYSVNLSGEVQVQYRLFNSPFRMDGMDLDSSLASWFHNFQPMLVRGRRLYVDPMPFHSGIDLYGQKKWGISEFGYFTFSSSPILPYTKLAYESSTPDSDKTNQDQSHSNIYYAQEQEYACYVPTKNDELILAYANDAHMYRFNHSTGEILRSTERGRFIPSPIPLAEKSITQPFHSQSTVYKELLFDEEKRELFRFATLPSPVELNMGDRIQFRKDYLWVGKYNEDLILGAQGLVPKEFKLHPRPTFSNGRFLGIAQGKDNYSITFQYTRITSKAITPGEYDSLGKYISAIEPQISERDFKGLIQEQNIPAGSVLVVASKSSCPYCYNHATEYFLLQLSRMEEEGVYLITSEEAATEALKEAQSKNIKVLPQDELERLIPNQINNPAIMLWDGKGVSRTMVLNPDDVVKIDGYLNLFLKQFKE
ncbi:MAG: hypothetical protein SchgKO_19650 [Schleiferiaceae bacterium]